MGPLWVTSWGCRPPATIPQDSGPRSRCHSRPSEGSPGGGLPSSQGPGKQPGDLLILKCPQFHRVGPLSPGPPRPPPTTPPQTCWESFRVLIGACSQQRSKPRVETPKLCFFHPEIQSGSFRGRAGKALCAPPQHSPGAHPAPASTAPPNCPPCPQPPRPAPHPCPLVPFCDLGLSPPCSPLHPHHLRLSGWAPCEDQGPFWGLSLCPSIILSSVQCPHKPPHRGMLPLFPRQRGWRPWPCWYPDPSSRGSGSWRGSWRGSRPSASLLFPPPSPPTPGSRSVRQPRALSCHFPRPLRTCRPTTHRHRTPGLCPGLGRNPGP